MPSGFSIGGTQGGGDPNYSMPSSLTPTNPIFIRAQINNTYRNIILDTGSGTTIVNQNFLQQIEHKSFRPISTSYSSADCTVIEIIGEVDLEIKINNLSTRITAAVAKDLVTDLLLGTDWINLHVLSIDIFHKRITVHDTMGRTSTTSIIQLPHSPCLFVSLIHPITIPQYSTYPAHVHVPISHCSNALFEPSEQLQRKSIIIPSTLINIHDHRTQLLITNSTDHPYIQLKSVDWSSPSVGKLISLRSSICDHSHSIMALENNLTQFVHKTFLNSKFFISAGVDD
jgi:hypothetical protein